MDEECGRDRRVSDTRKESKVGPSVLEVSQMLMPDVRWPLHRVFSPGGWDVGGDRHGPPTVGLDNKRGPVVVGVFPCLNKVGTRSLCGTVVVSLSVLRPSRATHLPVSSGYRRRSLPHSSGT